MTHLIDPKRLKVLFAVFGDDRIHMLIREGRRMIYEALSDADVNFEWIELNGVHAFMRDESSYGRYDPELAQFALGIAFAFYRRNLGGNVMIE
jgi:dienelactone hydrolase